MLLRVVNYVHPESAPETPAVGLLMGDRVFPLARLAAACPSVDTAWREPDAWRSALETVICEERLAVAQQCGDWLAAREPGSGDDLGVPRSQVRLLSPVPSPGKLFCLAQNFPSHAAEASTHITHSGISAADRFTPHVFLKPSPNTVCADGDPIVVSRTAQFVDYEGEVAVVIGRRGKYIRAEEAGQYVAGVTCCNDVSERKLRIWERQEEREWDHFFDWLNGKWMDTFCPLGPALVPAGSVNLDDLTVRCSVNGELRQQGNTGEMYHSAAKSIEYISHMLTLDPGDIVALGTPGGVGIAQGKQLAPGDVVTVEIEGLMCLSNPVVAE